MGLNKESQLLGFKLEQSLMLRRGGTLSYSD